MLFGNRFDLSNEANNRLVLLIRFAESGFELLMGVEQALDLLHGVDDEHVHQVLAGSIEPVVEWLQLQKRMPLTFHNSRVHRLTYSSAFGEFQVKLINLFEHSFGLFERLAARLSQRS